MNNYTQSTVELGLKSLREVFSRQRWLTASVAAIAIFATGCGGDESETIGTSEAAFSVAGCAEEEADAVFTGKIDPALVTPRSYNSCYKGYVVDVVDLDPAYTGEGNLRDARIRVAYADTALVTRASCEATEVAAVFYEFGATGSAAISTGNTSTTGTDYGWVPLTLEDKFGSWLFGRCDLSVQLTDLVAGKMYRVAATARTPSNATRKVSISTDKPFSR